VLLLRYEILHNKVRKLAEFRGFQIMAAELEAGVVTVGPA
jgi:hypothetical protein